MPVKIKMIDAVVSLDQNLGMGYQGDLLLHLKADMVWFKELTTTSNPNGNPHNSNKPNAVIMGRKTWESISERFRPLPDRLNYILTSRPDKVMVALNNNAGALNNSVYAFSRWDELLPHVRREAEAIFVIGGARVFKEALARPEFRYLYVTEFAKTFIADTFFPPFQTLLPKKVIIKTGNENGINFSIVRYAK